MNNKLTFLLIKHEVSLLLLLTFAVQLTTCFAQGTAFTYQGRLNDSGSAVNGDYDLRFTIYDSPSGGLVAGGPLTNAPTLVSNGLFTATMDFGAGVFDGNPRWLEIGVRTNGAASFATLAPRQKLTSAPYAIFANTASNVSGTISSANLSGTYGQPVTFNNAGNNFTGNGSGLTGVNAATLNGLSAGNFWQTTGNTGTTPGVNFLGTTDNQPLELHVNGVRALRLEPTTDLGTTRSNLVNVVNGASVNFVTAGVRGATIGGGGAGFYDGVSYTNSIAADLGTIGGGAGNTLQVFSDGSSIGGGSRNKVLGAYNAVIAGGVDNSVLSGASGATISGGYSNSASNNFASVAGGFGNLAGAYATVSGGHANSAAGNYATVGGGSTNSIQPGASYSVVAGGGQNAIQAVAYDANLGGYNSTISGGLGNTIGSPYATIGGGSYHSIGTNSNSGTIGGGFANNIGNNTFDSTISGGSYSSIGTNSFASTVAGGSGNSVGNNASFGTVGGGGNNNVSGSYAVVPGGYNNLAAGSFSFAAGLGSHADHDGTFVWSDASDLFNGFTSTGSNQFLIRAVGGVGINTNAPGGVALNVAGTVKATSFEGDGSGLVNVSSGALGNYVFAYTTAAQNVATPNTYQDISFNTDAQLSGWTHTGGTASYTCAQSGLYLIQYNAQATTALVTGTNVSVRATLNAVEIPGSQASVILSSTSIELLSLTRCFVANVSAADVFKLQFTGSSTASHLVGGGTGSTRPSISLTITRIQ